MDREWEQFNCFICIIIYFLALVGGIEGVLCCCYTYRSAKGERLFSLYNHCILKEEEKDFDKERRSNAL